MLFARFKIIYFCIIIGLLNIQKIVSFRGVLKNLIKPTPLPQCGYRDEPYRRIVGGSHAMPGSWPWIAIIGNYRIVTNQVYFFCGGTLISPRHIISAAHCFHEVKLWAFARMGEINLEGDDYTLDVPIERVYIHPFYNRTKLSDDIAVLRLDRNIEFTEYVHPICLPMSKRFLKLNLEEEPGYVAGWGSLGYGKSMSNWLREAEVDIIDNSECKDIFREMKIKNVEITPKVICAGNWRKNTCQGDSGGPLMYADGSIFYLIGVVSNGVDCGRFDTPAVYSRISSYLKFILANMD